MSDSSSLGDSSSRAGSILQAFDLETFFSSHGPLILHPGYGKDIDPTQVIPSMARPVWEPPALEILEVFESKFWEDREKKFEKNVPNITIRTELLDCNRLFLTIGKYALWARRTGKEAILREDLEKEGFYEGLLQELLVEFTTVGMEFLSLLKKHAPDFYDEAIASNGSQSGFKDEEESQGKLEEEFRDIFKLRSVDESSNASSTTASTKYEYDSDTTSQISDWLDNLTGLHELFTDWIDNVFDLDILFEEPGSIPATSPDPSPMPQEHQVFITARGPMGLKSGVLTARGRASLPPFSLHDFNQARSSTSRTQAETLPMSLRDPKITHQSKDLIDLELPATIFSISSAIPYSYDLIDLRTPVTNYQTSSTSHENILKSTTLNEMIEIDKL